MSLSRSQPIASAEVNVNARGEDANLIVGDKSVEVALDARIRRQHDEVNAYLVAERWLQGNRLVHLDPDCSTGRVMGVHVRILINSKERSDRAGDAVAVIDHKQAAPLVEGGADMRDTKAHKIADAQR